MGFKRWEPREMMVMVGNTIPQEYMLALYPLLKLVKY